MSGSVKKSAHRVNCAGTLTLCADDYGLAPGVSAAIRDLIGRGRLQATGCMTGSAHWPEAAQALRGMEGLAQIGLHITLTDQRPLGPMPRLASDGKFPPLGRLLKLALSGGLDRDEIAAEITRQFDCFTDCFGRPPDFIDGHHHVHQLPTIAPVVLELWQRRLHRHGWVRSCHEPMPAILARGICPVRALVISELGRGFARALKRHRIPHNGSFRGVYDFSGRVPFARLFTCFTERPGPRTLMMVHPGLVDQALRDADSLTVQREEEYRFLGSDECVFDLARRGIALRPMLP